MPGPYIHMSSMRHALENLAKGGFRPVRSDRISPTWVGADLKALSRLLDSHPNFANIGAVGPDLFFFLPDFRDTKIAGINIPISSVLIFVLDFLEEAEEAIDPFISKWEHYIGPISEDTAEEISRLTGGMSETVGDITGELGAILTTLLEDFITQQKDWWEYFSLGHNQGFDEQAFLWSDMLHYRQTGQFGRTLWQKALESKMEGSQAYALGYITHLATDVTGHAMVNAISGGPFRQHWQRHHLVENHMDAFWYLLDDDLRASRRTPGYRQMTESALYYDIAFEEETNNSVTRPGIPAGRTLRENWVRKRLLDIDSTLPDEVADLLVDTMTEVFYGEGGKHPEIFRENDGRPDADQVKQAYDLFFRFLKIVSVDGFNHELPMPPDVFPNLDFPTMSDPAGDSPPGDSDSDSSFWDDLLDFILSIVRVIAYIIEVAGYLATLPWAILADVVTYPLRLGLYYALELPLFHLLKNFRMVLVLTGYLSPMEDEINLPMIKVGHTESLSWNQVLGQVGDIFGGLEKDELRPEPRIFRDPRYPRLHPDDEYKHPWQYPLTGKLNNGMDAAVASETPLTTAGPFPRNADPSFLFRMVPANPNIRDGLENATTPNEADLVDRDLQIDRHMGDSVSFSEYLIWLATRTDDAATGIIDWNLDADRGYGYHCWDWDRHHDESGFPQQPDPEGKLFDQPCTWPSQANPDLDKAAPDFKDHWNADLPVSIHWTGPGLEDPGCNQPPPIG